MSPVNFPVPDPYDELPEVVKSVTTRKEYWTMGDVGRRELIQDLTEPDGELEDDFDAS